MDHIKAHFEEEAHEFDAVIRRLIPYYERMLEALILALPFEPSQPIHVLDLGCGTGTISRRIKSVWPKAKLTCLDLAENMLGMARTKLGSDPDVRYIRADFQDYAFDETWDAVVSSLALHHLASDRDKIEFYGKIFGALNPGGVFYNADVVLGSNAFLRERYMDQWRKFMSLRVSDEEIDGKWLPKYREEDRPAGLMDQLAWLRDKGFVDIDVVWKFYNYAVYGGSKPSDT
jgi:tRNA (cmo5U34)-methyltransferase